MNDESASVTEFGAGVRMVSSGRYIRNMNRTRPSLVARYCDSVWGLVVVPGLVAIALLVMAARAVFA